jgi:branched-chain amino acid transport system permease protein
VLKKHPLVTFIIFGFILFLISNRIDELAPYQGATVAIYVIAIASLILLTGYSGQISLGHGALMAIGGYAAVLVRINFNAPVWLTFVVAVLAAAVGGALLGLAAARLSGPYLAGTTLALAIGLPSIANEFSFLGGEQGFIFDVGFPPASLGEDFTQYKWYFWISWSAALIATYWLRHVLNSRYGRSWRAVRSNDVAAELAGIHVGRNKVLAFTISAGLAGLAGALLGMTLLVSPGAFPLALSFSLATGAVLAGVTTLGGVMIGAVTLVAIPEIALAIADRYGGSETITLNLPGLLVSGLLILTVLLVPNGPVEQMHARRAKHAKNGKTSHSLVELTLRVGSKTWSTKK